MATLLRILLGVAAIGVFIGVLSLVSNTLQILRFLPDASAIQVSQVHTEAQTFFLGGILAMLMVVALAITLPPMFVSGEPAKAPPVGTALPQSKSSSESS